MKVKKSCVVLVTVFIIAILASCATAADRQAGQSGGDNDQGRK